MLKTWILRGSNDGVPDDEFGGMRERGFGRGLEGWRGRWGREEREMEVEVGVGFLERLEERLVMAAVAAKEVATAAAME
ncbi:hypothetical protein CDL15_Pgr006567 [Punica granatum]|nr:hypothetical protein CDL15_Pgr006567 [Punica granatum]